MTIILDGSSLTVEKLVAIARHGEQVELAPAAAERINVCRAMIEEKIKVRATASGQVLEVVVDSKRADRIEVVVGAGVHSVRCDLLPTRTGQAYSGSVMGRELVYERSRAQVEADIAKTASVRDFRR